MEREGVTKRRTDQFEMENQAPNQADFKPTANTHTCVRPPPPPNEHWQTHKAGARLTMQSSMIPEATFAQASRLAPYVFLVWSDTCWLHLVKDPSYVYVHPLAHCVLCEVF